MGSGRGGDQSLGGSGGGYGGGNDSYGSSGRTGGGLGKLFVGGCPQLRVYCEKGD